MLNPQTFVSRWRGSTLTERSAYQQHFMDLCSLVGHQTPAQMDQTGESFTFEAGATKQGGGQGWADVWKRGYFAWEYKGKHKDLDKAYQQLLQYRESLENPPLLVVSDMDRILIHTNFTNTVKKVVTIGLDDLLTSQGMQTLRSVFFEPEAFRITRTTAQVTADAAEQFARLAERLREANSQQPTANSQQPTANSQQPTAHDVAHFLIRILFCLFAEDIGLLRKDLFSDLVRRWKYRPSVFATQLSQLFSAMSTGGAFGTDEVAWFNGGLFDNATVLDLDVDGLEILSKVCDLDWSSIEPSILGTLFERSLDPSKRSQLGAHYTSMEDILLIVEPVLMAPLRRQVEEVKAKAREIAQRKDETESQRVKTNRQSELVDLFRKATADLSKVRVLDPACGSGNFLYVALKQLLDLEKEVITAAGAYGIPAMIPSVSPRQLFGIEINEYAHELAQATIWIGYIQWLNDNGFGRPAEPILQRLDTIQQIDSILSYEDGKAAEPAWPEVDVIIGNPPFLGDKRMRGELGTSYISDLRSLYENRVRGGADLVTYWFEKARHELVMKRAKRIGLLATNSIRFGANREILDRIQATGRIFWAWSDRPWTLDGAAVRVSMIGFDDGTETSVALDGQRVNRINSDLTSSVNIAVASRLNENAGIAFIGTQKTGPFDISQETAVRLLAMTGNPNGRSNADVVRPWLNGSDIVGRPSHRWIVDFGIDRSIGEASEYEAPFEYVRTHVRPKVEKGTETEERNRWWLFTRPRPGMRKAIRAMERYIASPRVAKHRLYVFVSVSTVPDSRVVVIARQDDYFIGVLQSHVHEAWSIRTASRHGVGNDPTYNAESCFETFPFPWPPGHEPTDDPRVIAISEVAKELVEKRDRWLNPDGTSESELKRRTLTNLYNQRPTWLDLLHKKLDEAVLDAYGWPHDLTDEEILERLLALNQERARGEKQ